MEESMNLAPEQVRLLLIACDGDAALLYLWQKSEKNLPCPLSGQRLENAAAVLHRLGLDTERRAAPRREVRPEYTEEAVTRNLNQSREFSLLVGETQRTLGRILSTEELKCLLSICDYLRLPGEVISILISYCVQVGRARSGRAPSLRAVEKEAYRWADEGIDNVDAAVAYVQQQLAKLSRMGRVAELLQLSGRRLTRAEENYVATWIGWGFPDEVIRLAYEKTCLATGCLKWPYLNSILASWNEKGLKTLAQIREGDGKKPAGKKREVSDFEREAVRKLMAEKEG